MSPKTFVRDFRLQIAFNGGLVCTVLRTRSLISNNFATLLGSANYLPNHQNTSRPRFVDPGIDILKDHSYMHNSTLF
jgi:hypothetical protein